MKGTGLANTCPTVEGGGKTALKLNGKNYINEFCLEPTSFQVLEDKLTKAGVVTEAVNTKVTTRQTYVLTGIEGDLVSDGGKPQKPPSPGAVSYTHLTLPTILLV